jgi:histone acetyltransferase (RNA polymerase elongator complex component)
MQLIIPIFIMHRGCPHRCIFCNVRKTAGNHPERLSEEAFCEIVNKYLESVKERPDRVQIAFYGGNFTGMAKGEQIELLKFARPFIKKGVVNSIRISTRPDCIDTECLDMLKAFGVTTVEIGAQSMMDDVLNLANRGHTSADVASSLKMLKQRGLETGMHLMVGLPGDSRSSFENTVEKTIALKPDSVRIHPTLVLEDTDLAKAYLSKAYIPLILAEAVEICKFALRKFEEARIPVIRIGLHTTREMEAPGNIIAGPHHPAFRSLVEESIYFDMASSLLDSERVRNKAVTFVLSPKDVSSFRGQKNRNLQRIKKRFGLAEIHVSVDPHQPRRSLNIMMNDRILKPAFADKIEQGASIV